MIPVITALLKSARFWAVIGASGAIIAFLTWGYNQIYDAGYNDAELKWRTAQQAAIEDAVAEARANWEVADSAAEDNIRVETEIVERVRVVEREVPRIVERVVPGECRDLGPDIQRVYNDAIRAANQDGGGSTSDPAQPPEEM